MPGPHGIVIKKLWPFGRPRNSTVETSGRQTAAPGDLTEGVVMESLVLDKPVSQALDPLDQTALDDYTKVAEEIGLIQPDLKVEALKRFLFDSGITVFSLAAVIPYMDAKAEKEREGLSKRGWFWRPLRECDQMIRVSFGQPNQWDKMASDYYVGPSFVEHNPPIENYDLRVPLHALNKVAKITRDFKYAGDVKFFVCDYAVPLLYDPDPFLMAVIANRGIATGAGRFVIDFWDEPGFGLERQLATDG